MTVVYTATLYHLFYESVMFPFFVVVFWFLLSLLSHISCKITDRNEVCSILHGFHCDDVVVGIFVECIKVENESIIRISHSFINECTDYVAAH